MAREIKYAVVLRPLSQEEGGGWMASVPDLPGCMSDGDSPHEALDNVADAIGAWLDAARDLGRQIPEPSASPAALEAAKG